MKTLITGATGHLGSNFVRAFIEKKEKPRVLLRQRSGNRSVQGLDIEKVYGDLSDPHSLSEAVKGCKQVYHLAAFVSIRCGDQSELYNTNVLGTRNLLEACRKEGVDRVVHCSSFGAIGINPHGPSDEAWSLHPFEEAADYEISKAFSEFEVYKQIINGLDVVIVNPSTIVGPWDFRPSLLGNTIIEFGKGKMKAYIDGAYDFVAVKDVVAGLFAAMERGKTGERYILTNENLTILQTLEWLEELTGKRKPQIKIPIFVMQNAAIIKDWLERKFFPNATPRFNYHSIRMLQSGKYGDNTKARKELGIEFTSVKKAFEEAVEWFKINNYL